MFGHHTYTFKYKQYQNLIASSVVSLFLRAFIFLFWRNVWIWKGLTRVQLNGILNGGGQQGLENVGNFLSIWEDLGSLEDFCAF